MLIKCPECELQVSDKARACPHCGYPLIEEEVKISRPKKSRKHKRLPNGFGQITEIKGQNLRNPYRAMVTIGKDENGRPICKLLKPQAYFATYNEAYLALMEYNKNPYDLTENITMSELYDRWYKKYSTTVKSKSAMQNHEAAWAFCSYVYDMDVRDVRIKHLKYCIEHGEKIVGGKVRKTTDYTASRIKTLFNLLMDYAIEYDIIDRNYARDFNPSFDTSAANSHMPYSDDEVDVLWRSIDFEYIISIILIQCYSGWRPGELFNMRRCDVNLKEGYFVGGSKTEAGENRKVPIHPKIYHLVEQHYNSSAKYDAERIFIRPDGKNITYSHFKNVYDKMLKTLNLNPEHRPHDGRVYFITKAKKYNVDEYAIKRIVGHRISDITEKIYTLREFDWYVEEIQKIK